MKLYVLQVRHSGDAYSRIAADVHWHSLMWSGSTSKLDKYKRILVAAGLDARKIRTLTSAQE